MARPTDGRIAGPPSCAPHEGWMAKDSSASWLARHRGLWARALAPLRPLDAPATRATARQASWPLARDLRSAGVARRAVTGRLHEWGLDHLAESAELLVSELVTNALRHAPGPVRLNMRVTGTCLRCEVEDTHLAAPVRRGGDRDAEGGRGTELLDLLSDGWGSHVTGTGKTTWFELAVPPCPESAADAGDPAR